MEFKKDYSYLYLTKNEYTEPFINEVVKCICFYGTDKFNEEYTEIKEWLEENFIMYQYKDTIDYVIFKSLHLTRILKVNSIPNIINATDYSNFFVHSIPGCFFSYGFHVGDDTRPPWE